MSTTQTPRKLSDPCYIIHLSVEGLFAEVWFNGWLAHRTLHPKALEFQTKANAFVLEGNNSIELRLRRWPSDEELRESLPVDRVPRAAMYLAVVEHGAPMDEMVYLTRFDFNALESPKEGTVFQHGFFVRNGFGEWAWETAAPYASSDRPEIEALIGSLHSRYAAKDIDGIQSAMSLKLEEMARAVNRTPAEFRASLTHSLTTAFSSCVVFPNQGVELEAMAEGRLVKVTDGMGEAPIKMVALGTAGYMLETLVSKIDGAWRVVR